MEQRFREHSGIPDRRNEEAVKRSSAFHLLCECVSEDTALKIMEHFAGLRVRIPKGFNRTAGANLCKIVGEREASNIMSHLGGALIEFPAGTSTALKALIVERLLGDDCPSAPRLAQEIGCSERYVRKVRSEVFGEGPMPVSAQGSRSAAGAR